MSKSRKNRPQEEENPETQGVAVLDPPESGPPTEAELGQDEGDREEALQSVADQIAAPGEAVAGTVASNPAPMSPRIDPVMAAIHGALAAQSRTIWPIGPLNIDWPWGDEPDPQIGDIAGWNWQQNEVAVVAKAPKTQFTEPWTVRVELQPMPASWHKAKVFDMNTGERHDGMLWYTRWNRAGEKHGPVSGRLAVIEENLDSP